MKIKMVEEKNEYPDTRSESAELSDRTDYPWRANFYTNARCSCCKIFNWSSGCGKGLDVQYPTYATVHKCEGYEFNPSEYKRARRMGKIKMFMAIIDARPECAGCVHNLEGECNGIHWYPFQIKNGKCEFYRNKALLCKYAIPYFQYGERIKNHYCMKSPALRDGDQKQGWEWNCPNADSPLAEELKCYEARGEDDSDWQKICPKCGTSARVQKVCLSTYCIDCKPPREGQIVKCSGCDQEFAYWTRVKSTPETALVCHDCLMIKMAQDLEKKPRRPWRINNHMIHSEFKAEVNNASEYQTRYRCKSCGNIYETQPMSCESCGKQEFEKYDPIRDPEEPLSFQKTGGKN